MIALWNKSTRFFPKYKGDDMKYQIFRLEFTTGVHFGRTSLEGSRFLFGADTLFSALCIEAMKIDDQSFKQLYSNTKNGKLVLSDGLPYINDSFYIPRPHLMIERSSDGSSVQKKAYKKLSHIPMTALKGYLNGNLDAEKENNILQNIGTVDSRTGAAVRGQEETLPYRIGTFRFSKNAGIYIIVGTSDEDISALIEELLLSLSFTGIGGKRSQGLGKFSLYREKKLPVILEEGLKMDSNHYMTLSVSLPRDDELEKVISGSQYKLLKRSGFVCSDSYAESFQRKRDMYLFAAGSCFTTRFEGDVYDVSGFGNHPVYRYAKPVFMGVSR